MKKSNAQKDFEKQQKNLKNRIKRLEEKGYEFEDAITSMKKTKYKSLSPKAASVMKAKMMKLNKEMLTQTSRVKSFKTPSTYIIKDKEELKAYRTAKVNKKKRDNKKKLDDIILQKRFENLKDKNKKMLSNFYKGLDITLEGVDEMSIEKARLLKAISFMQKLSPGTQLQLLKYLNKNTTEFMSTIWDSDQLFDTDNWLAIDQFEILENRLRDKYNYNVPSDIDLAMAIEKEQAYLIYDRKFIRQNNIKEGN